MPIPMKPGRKPTLPDARYSGIYEIVNTVNWKRYVGSAVNITSRLNDHRKALRGGHHENPHLQAAWNKYGEVVFRLKVVERCEPEQLIEREQYWMDQLMTADNRYGYNCCPTAGNMLGFRHSEESKNKMSETRKGKPLSEAFKQAAANVWRGKKLPAHVREAAAKASSISNKRPKSEEHKAKISAGSLRRWACPGEKERMSVINRNARPPKKQKVKRTPEEIHAILSRPRSEEAKANISAGLRGKPKSAEHCANIKATHWSKRPDAAEIAARTAEKNRGRKQTPEHLAKKATAARESKRIKEFQTLEQAKAQIDAENLAAMKSA